MGEQIEMTEDVAEEKDDSKDTEKGKNCVETLSAGLNLADRDGKSINNDVCLDFDDVLAEPGSTHGLDPVWQISSVLFSQTKLWLYRIFAALVAIPAALMWALVFSLITVV